MRGRRARQGCSLMLRESRERYRVYSADEFLAALAVDPRAASEQPGDVDVASSKSLPASHRRRTRLAGATLLLGAIGSVGGLTTASLLGGQRTARSGRPATASRRPSATLVASRLERRAAPRVSDTRSPTAKPGRRRLPSIAHPQSRPGAVVGRPIRVAPVGGHAELAAVRVPVGERPEAIVVPRDGGPEFGFER
jgi:hypothetical protein